MTRDATDGFKQVLLETVGKWHYVLLNAEGKLIDDEWNEKKPVNHEEVLRHYEQGGLLGLVPASLNFIAIHAFDNADAVVEVLGAATYQNADPVTEEYRYIWYKVGGHGYHPLKTKYGYVHTDDWFIPVSNGDIVLLYARYLDDRYRIVSLHQLYGGPEPTPALELEPPDDPTPDLGKGKGKGEGKREIPTQFDYSFLYAADCKQELCYCDDTGSWYQYNGTRWIDGRCRSVGKAMSLIIDHGTRAQQTAAFAKSVVKLAESNSILNIRQDQFDGDAELLGLPETVYDFRAGGEREGKHDDYITLDTGTYIAQSVSALWEDFVLQFMPDNDTRLWLQLLFGQALIGRQTEHILPFLCGTGANGKTVLVEAIKNAIGSYAGHLDSENLLHTTGSRHTTDLAALWGKRLVIVDELPDNAVWNMSLIKQITGGGQLTARFMHKDNFTYTPKFLIVVLSNDKPRLRTVDDSVKRRLRMIPCTNKIPEAEQDTSLPGKLAADSDAVLKWLIDGANQYVDRFLHRGRCLHIPDLVRQYSDTYFEIQDPVSQLITDSAESTEIPFYYHSDGRVLRTTALKSARAAMPMMRWTQPKLAALLEKQGIATGKVQGNWYYIGIAETAYQPEFQNTLLR